MKLPLQVTFRHMKQSDAIEKLVRQKAAKLERFSNEIMGCRVVVEPMGKRHAQGNLYDVRIDLTVPGEEIAVTRKPSERVEYRDIHIALRDAFDSAGRLIEDYARRKRGQVKSLTSDAHARVSKLFSKEGYGFLTTPDGRDIYFHKNAVPAGFDRLAIGTEVAFVESTGKEGPQASTVKPVGKHGHRGP